MMSSVRTKCELSEAAEDDRRAKEKDMKMISNARDIFKTLETNEGVEEEVSREKVKRVEVKTDFLLSGQNKAEEMRLERIRELQAMKIARERELEEEERMRSMEMNRENLIKRQRENEMEMMRMARQQAMEEEEQRQQMEAANQRAARQISPGLAAARQGLKIDDRDHEEDRVGRMRYERERELNEMRKARARQEFEQEDTYRQEKSDASKELEAFRASQQTSNIRNRYPENQNGGFQQPQQAAVRAAPKKKVVGDNWIRRDQEEEDKLEELRRGRERELEMMLNARNEAFEEEEEERRAWEAARREEAERKGKEMALLVAELQRMRNETQQQADGDPKMTRYQEEMLQRVIELQAITAGQN